MCKHGDTINCYVPIPAYLSHTGTDRWDWKAVDRCIAPIVDALNRGGVHTATSCCGHGKMDGEIWLADGRVLRITRPNDALEVDNANG